MITRFSDVLASCLQDTTWQGYLLRHWSDIVGDLHTRICLERISGTTLFIGVHDVHWMQELFCLGQELMAHINGHLTADPVRGASPTGASPIGVSQNGVARVEKLLTDRQTHALAQISDPQLQEIMRQLMVRGR
jgi:hypothetical protein